MDRSKGCDGCAAMMIQGVFCHETGCYRAAEERAARDAEDREDDAE